MNSYPAKEEIAVAAYMLYQKRGCRPGFDLEDWLTAEASLKSQIESDQTQEHPNGDDSQLDGVSIDSISRLQNTGTANESTHSRHTSETRGARRRSGSRK